jgi:hypothetical protein
VRPGLLQNRRVVLQAAHALLIAIDDFEHTEHCGHMLTEITAKHAERTEQMARGALLEAEAVSVGAAATQC